MRLSNRLWRAIAWRFSERLDCPPCICVWAKVALYAKGKRHALTTITLTPAETAEVARLFAGCRDSYWMSAVRHEQANVR